MRRVKLIKFLLQLLFATEIYRFISASRVVVISFDGFRYDYYGSVPMPNLDFIVHTGVHSPEGAKSVFATKTFPAHWSIATGLYEESHGILDNYMYDPVKNKTFKFGGAAEWWGGEPIWVTAKKQGKKVGIYFWPGSDVSFNGVTPDYYFPYNDSTPFEHRIRVASDWVVDKKLDLVMMYFNQPDKFGHKYGAASDEVKKSLIELDNILGILLSKLKASNKLNTTDILVISDHGMTNITLPPIILSNYISVNDTKYIDAQKAIAGIEPKEGKLDHIYRQLKNANPHMKVYLKDEIPERFHYKNHRLIKSIIAVADEGHVIYENFKIVKGKGNHGYDNELKSMRPFFAASGPHFKSAFNSSTFEIINYYPLLCHLLNIKEAPNNGSFKNVQSLMKSNSMTVNYHFSYVSVAYLVIQLLAYFQAKHLWL